MSKPTTSLFPSHWLRTACLWVEGQHCFVALFVVHISWLYYAEETEKGSEWDWVDGWVYFEEAVAALVLQPP